MTIRYFARILLALLVATALGCGGGGGGGGGTTPPANPTKATLTFSIPSLPAGTQVGGVQFTVNLPPGVSPAVLSGANDASGSVSLTGGAAAAGNLSFANFTPSAASPQISIVVAAPSGFGTGNFAVVNCVIAPGTTVSTSGFSLSNIKVVDTNGTSIPSASATVSIAVQLS